MREGRILREFNFIASRDADSEFTGKFMDFCEDADRTMMEAAPVIRPAAGLRRRSAVR
ncbi:hypothetical protein SDC9_193967 [bioreactor metagenome]|uniref:Uncharacterized protein n=1 Tax=bioreactor metagenome TaxID=1076179 RepID=A0A645I503_9ZZZZ